MTVWYSDGYEQRALSPMYQQGKKLKTVHFNQLVDASELTDGDTFVLAGPISMQDRIHRILSPNATPALTSATDNDIGFYYNKEGVLTVIDKDILVDGMTLASALTARDLLKHGNSSLLQYKNIGEMLGKNPDQEYAGGVYLVLTMNTKSTADGTLDLDIQIEEATTN